MQYYFASQRKLHVNENLASSMMLQAPPTSASLFRLYYNHNSVCLINIDLIIMKVIPQPAHYWK